MWCVPRFAEYHRYNIIIVENVVDARKWVMFDSWIHAMHSLGYNHKCVYMNSMFCHPTPQSRDRMYVVFWKKKNKAPDLDFRPKAFCYKCEKVIEAVQSWKPGRRWGKYKTQYEYCCPHDNTVVQPYYHAAFNCIDWSDIGKRIGDRNKPLSDNTVRRIQYGLKKYGKEPMVIVNYSPGYAKSLRDASATMTSNDHHALLTPFIINDQQRTGVGFRVKGVEETFQTCSTQNHLKLIMPFIIKGEHTLQEGYVRSLQDASQTQTVRQSMALVTPFIVEMNRTGKARSVKEPVSTITTSGTHHYLALPFVVENKGQSKSKSLSDPLGTLTTKSHHGLITTEAWKSFLSYNYNGHQTSNISEPTDSMTTKERASIITYQEPKLEDCYYRMLKPHEIKLAMAFGSDYIVLGSGKDQVKQLGNAVTPPVMEWLLERAIQSLA
jgi:DNA (cytosine-5)-methyltransferase 1